MSDKEKIGLGSGARLLNLKQTMIFLGLDTSSYKTLRKLLLKENIPVLKVGDSEKVDILDLEKMINEKKISVAC